MHFIEEEKMIPILSKLSKRFLSTKPSPFKRFLYDQGDFLIDGKIILEVGGKSKDAKQIVGVQDAYLAIDDIESGYDNVVPLWLFGFLY